MKDNVLKYSSITQSMRFYKEFDGMTQKEINQVFNNVLKMLIAKEEQENERA